MKQRELEISLQSLKGFDSPDPRLEQYPTPPVIAADVLYAACGMGDVGGKAVIDLGCGTGVFSVGASLLGARMVVGVDADPKVLDLARKNATTTGCDIEFRRMDVREVEGRFDTCIQNPPFGSQTRHADLPFLRKALEIAAVVYTMHNSKTMDFLEKEVGALGRTITHRKHYSFEIRHSFRFHRKERESIDVALLRIE
jgi:putative methylase